MLRARPPHDNRLFESLLTIRTGDTLNPRIAEHLADCRAARRGYAELVTFLDDVAADASAESDAVFTRERLGPRRSRFCGASITSAVRPASSAFRATFRPLVTCRRRPGSRPAGWRRQRRPACSSAWPSEPSLEWQRHAQVHTVSQANPANPANEVNDVRSADPVEPINQIAQSTPDAHDAALPAAAPVATDGNQTSAPSVAADDAFLSDLETALERNQTRELRALDALTPHVREVREIRYVR